MKIRTMGILGFVGLSGFATLALAATSVDQSVASALKARLPKTAVNKVDCDKIKGICEVTAGTNLFYVDHSARYLVIGRVYDMETRQDVTAARLLELNPDMLVGGAASAARREENAELASEPQFKAAQPTAASRKLDLSSLPKNGAIVWGASGGQTLTVFSDFRCGYCQRLSQTLASMNVRVIERPISILGSRELANQVLCASDQRKALEAAYRGETVSGSPKCDTSGLDANEKFAREMGLGGTPIIVRSDGAMLEGFRPRAALEAWLKGSR